ncbi:MAG: PA2817 family protein [Halioglobus sp.]
MNDKQYREHCQALLADFSETLMVRTAQLPEDHPLRELAEGFATLTRDSDAIYRLGPELTARLFDTYPEFAPTFPRQLLWFFGGDCLHYMADEEIGQFQQLEELRLAAASRGETFNWQASRAKLLNLQ